MIALWFYREAVQLWTLTPLDKLTICAIYCSIVEETGQSAVYYFIIYISLTEPVMKCWPPVDAKIYQPDIFLGSARSRLGDLRGVLKCTAGRVPLGSPSEHLWLDDPRGLPHPRSMALVPWMRSEKIASSLNKQRTFFCFFYLFLIKSHP